MSKRKQNDSLLKYQTEEFFLDSLNNPGQEKFYSKKYGYIYINIAITRLDVYKNLRDKYNKKINYKYTIKQYTDDQICQYVFMRLFRVLFFFDYIHDFVNRTESNNLFKDVNVNKKFEPHARNVKKKELINIYNKIYKEDILDIYRFIFKNNETQFSNIKKFDENIILLDTKLNLNILNNIQDQNLSEENIKKIIVELIKYFDIIPIDIEDNIKNCGETFDDIIRNINDKSISKKKIELFVDADKSRFSLYPILNKFCSLLFTNLDNITEINYNKSMLDNFDSASSSSLRTIIDKLKSKIYPNNINIQKINNINLPFKKIIIIIKLNEYDSYENRFIELNFKQNNIDNTVGLNVNRFFTLSDTDTTTLSDSSLNVISNIMNDILKNNKKLNKYDDFILNSYRKTMGDFSQIILVYQLSIIDNNNIYLFLTFDKISSYISSLFNKGTLKEEDENPLLPLKYFKTNFDTKLQQPRPLTPQFTKQQKLNFGKTKKKSNRKMTRILNLAKKYNVSYKNLTYKKLYDKLNKLYKLQLLAKKLKIPITYTKQIRLNNKFKNKRFYKSSKILINEIKKKNRNFI